MSRRIGIEDIARFPEAIQRQVAGQLYARAPATSKYRNVRTQANGIKFPSKLQAKHYAEFQTQLAAGAIRGYAHEVSIPLGNSRRRIRIDHMVVSPTGAIRWLDSKGKCVDQKWFLKRDLIEAQLGIVIECI